MLLLPSTSANSLVQTISIVLHLEAMKQVPTLLKSILESDSIVKQAVGGGSFQRGFFEEYDKYETHPHQVLDLRVLALKLFPELFPERHEKLSHSSFIKLAANALLDLDISSTTAGESNSSVYIFPSSSLFCFQANFVGTSLI